MMRKEELRGDEEGGVEGRSRGRVPSAQKA
jgi:hypothetical protein